MEAVRENTSSDQQQKQVQPREKTAEEKELLLRTAPAPPQTDPAAFAAAATNAATPNVNVTVTPASPALSVPDSPRSRAPSQAQSVREEEWEALEALKDVSLQALGMLVRRLAEDPGNESEQQPRSTSPALVATPTSTPGRELSTDQKEELARLVRELPSGQMDKVQEIVIGQSSIGERSGKLELDTTNLSPSKLWEVHSYVKSLSNARANDTASVRSRTTSTGSKTSANASHRMSWHDALRDDDSYSTGNGGGNIWEIAEKAESIKDGGNVAALLLQPSTNRSKSAEMLRMSSSNTSLSQLLQSAPVSGTHSPAASASEVMPPSIGEDASALTDEMLTDHGLALALAALCNGLYQIFEASPDHHQHSGSVRSPEDGQGGAPDIRSSSSAATSSGGRAELLASASGDSTTMYSEIAQKLSDVQSQRAPADRDALTPGQQALWAECDRLMMLVKTICAVRQVPPTEPPPYIEANEKLSGSASKLAQKEANGAQSPTTVQADELTQVLSAIDRVGKFAPRLDNQTVVLTPRQQRDMSGAALTALVARLHRGKEEFDSQRAGPSVNNKYAALQTLVDRITVAGERSMTDQRVAMSGDIRRRVELGKLGAVLDRQEKTRFPNQDYISREQRFLADLTKLTPTLGKTSPKYVAQRYDPSPNKQRTMFISGLGARVERLGDRRMVNQDALTPAQKREQSFDELERIMDRMPQGLSTQRASVVSTGGGKPDTPTQGRKRAVSFLGGQ
ncbi:hypothetical protein HKX48_009339 [Thoreauomyces humboldtii]|nr:hypothetical protein HKX48_009339 [Thoreauomyces humboldtii]